MCSNPWNLEVASLSLQRAWLGREGYSKTMADNMKKLFGKYDCSCVLVIHGEVDDKHQTRGANLEEPSGRFKSYESSEIPA